MSERARKRLSRRVEKEHIQREEQEMSEYDARVLEYYKEDDINQNNDYNDNITVDPTFQPMQENEGFEHSIDFSEVVQFAMRFNLSTFVMSAWTNLVAKGWVISEGIFYLIPSSQEIT